jgi:hypothetical protein
VHQPGQPTNCNLVLKHKKAVSEQSGTAFWLFVFS